jgi:hypothetical protein
MEWHVGQKVQCDRSEQALDNCLIVAVEASTITISCPDRGILICGTPQRLESTGWHPIDTTPR